MTRCSIHHPFHQRRRRVLAALGVISLASLGVIGVGLPVAAVLLEPMPEATFAVVCGPSFGHVDVTLSNTGNDTAEFSVGVSYSEGGGAGWSIFVTPGDTTVLPINGGDEIYTVTVVEKFGYSNSAVFDVDCTQTSASLELVCHDGQPFIEASAVTSGLPTPFEFVVDGHVEGQSSTGRGSFSHALANGTPYEAWIKTGEDGILSYIEGIADCVPAENPTTSVPGSVVTVPGGSPTPDTTVPGLALDASSPPSVAATTALPATGRYSAAIAALATGLAGLGLMLRRVSRRPLAR